MTRPSTLLVLLLSLVTLAQSAPAQSIAGRAKARSDSAFALTACWRPLRPLPTRVLVSRCPDAAEAARLVAFSPLARTTSEGVVFMARQGDTLTIRALVVEGAVFLGPARGRGLGFVHTDALVTATGPGRVMLTLVLNGLTGRAALLILPRPIAPTIL